MSAEHASRIASAVSESRLSIYSDLTSRPDLYFSLELVQQRLRDCLIGEWLGGPPRSRSKLAKQMVCTALGYPVPPSFTKVQPRFPGQHLDIAVQQADNVQVWNAEVDPTCRYALIRPDASDIVRAVRVITGDVLAALDTTGTLTSKYQAKRLAGRTGSSLVTGKDTRAMSLLIGGRGGASYAMDSTADAPTPGKVLPIAQVYDSLLPLIGREIHDPGPTQDRQRGEILQAEVAAQLAVGAYENFGQWPDIRSQALEVKLQMSPTIDLGIVLPSSGAPAETLGPDLTHSDVRYAVFYGSSTPRHTVRLDAVVLTTGENFFDEFQAFGGLTINRKIQIRLPQGFFDAE